MKKILLSVALAAAIVTACPDLAAAQAAPAAAAPYSSTDTPIGTLLEDAAAKAVLEKHFAGLTTADSIQMASGMTLRQLQQFKPDMFTNEALAKLDVDLAALKKK